MRSGLRRLCTVFFAICGVIGGCSCGKFFPDSSSSSSSGSSSGSNSGGFAYVANSGSQNISAFSINSSTGALTALSGLPFSVAATPNVLAIDPQNRFLFAGLNGAGIEVFSIGSGGALTQVASGGSAASGTSPLAFAVTPNGSRLYVLDVQSSTISSFTIGSSGALTAAKGTALPSGSTPEPGLAIDAAGTHLYAAAGIVGIFSGTINSDGSLTQTIVADPPTGTTLQSLAIAPSGAFLYGLDPNNGVVGYSVTSGGLTLLNNGNPFATGASSTAVAVDATSKFVLVTNSGSNNVSSFTVNSDGTLTAVSGSPFSSGSASQALTFDRSGKFVYVAGSSGVTIFKLDTTTVGKLAAVSTVNAGMTPVSIVATH